MHKDKLSDISFSGIIKTSFPMMVSALSSHLMIILDQLVLAYYSIESIAIAASASSWSAVIQCLMMSSTMISGVFAGQLSGAKKYKLAGAPVWQMIWFSVFLFLVSVPAANYLGDYCITERLHKEGIPYFKNIVYFAPLCGIIYSLSSFFSAIGMGYLVAISSFAANIVNLFFDIVLVFGFFGIDEFKGPIGASVGTVIALFFEFIILFIFFLKKNIREKYGTLNCKIRIKKMKKCLKLGIPGSIGHTIELTGWSLIYYFLARISNETAIIQSMACSINLFLCFVVSGFERGVFAISSHLLGSHKEEKITLLLKRSIILQLCYSFALFFVFYFFPEIITQFFIKFDVPEEILKESFFILKLVWLYFLMDGLCWIIAGVIEAGGDIVFVAWTVSISIWLCVVMPCFIMSHYDALSVKITWCLLIVFILSVVIAMYKRFKSNKWIKIQI